jgi:hypothetical protein
MVPKPRALPWAILRRRFQRRKILRGLKDAVFRGASISPAISFLHTSQKRRRDAGATTADALMKNPASSSFLRLNADRVGCMFPVGLKKSQRTF